MVYQDTVVYHRYPRLLTKEASVAVVQLERVTILVVNYKRLRYCSRIVDFISQLSENNIFAIEMDPCTGFRST